MAATLHIIPNANEYRKKRLHANLELGSRFTVLRRSKRSKLMEKYTPPPSASSSEEDYTPKKAVSVEERKVRSARSRYRKRSLKVDTSNEAECVKPNTDNQKSEIEKEEDTNSALNSNPDYITLCSTLSLLYSQKQKIESDIVELNSLKSKFHENPKSMYQKLFNGDLRREIPSRNKIVRCPTVDFTKYGITNSDDQTTFNNELSNDGKDDVVFRTSNIFG